MTYIDSFKTQTDLIEKYGEDKAHLVWVLGIYLDSPDLFQLATECLTDGMDDKKIDFIKVDIENKTLTIAQGAYSTNGGLYKAKSNKASDLNTAIAWILSGDLDAIRTNESDKFENSLKEITVEIRDALEKNEIEEIEIFYVHNYAESKNVADELETVKNHLQKLLNNSEVIVSTREFGIENIERIFRFKESDIIVNDEIILSEKPKFEEKSANWKASIFTVKGQWLKDLFDKYGDDLFSANYRNFLGISKRGRKKINSGIKNTADTAPKDFWAFNNGITILTTKFFPNPDNPNQTMLRGISIINGAQTTGSISHSNPYTIEDVKVLCRVIESTNPDVIKSIIEFNNTQNAITSWDRYSKNPEQIRIQKEFEKLGYPYSFRRGFANNSELSIEVVAQPTTALHGEFLKAGSGKNTIFDDSSLYEDVFQTTKAKHLLLAYCLLKAVDVRFYDLKEKNNAEKCTSDESNQLSLLRYLRFKYFIVSIIGNCFENIVGEKVDLRTVSFANGVANSDKNSIDDLIKKCVPLVSLILTIISKRITQNFTDIMYSKEEYRKIQTNVSDAIDGLKLVENPIFSDFSKLIAPKG